MIYKEEHHAILLNMLVKYKLIYFQKYHMFNAKVSEHFKHSPITEEGHIRFCDLS
jgi:hypothetical protein